MSDPRYPIGHPELPERPDAIRRGEWLAQLADLPRQLREVVSGLSDTQLDTPYREGGWTVRQVTHHVPDSHLNAYVRMKLALTEVTPTIKPYDEEAWATLPDAVLPVEVSLRLTEALHERWAALLNALDEAAWDRTFHHPASGQTVPLGHALGLYAWHGRHHVAHVRALRERQGW